MPRTLTILFTSDIHGYFFPTDYIHTEPRPMGLGALGAGMRSERDENTLTIDGGDTLQGSPLAYYAAHHGGARLMAQMMNTVRYDYVTLGNHDFNYGRDILSGYAAALDARILAANIKDLKNEMPVSDFDIRTMPNGLRVGIVGIATDWINRWEKPYNLKTFRVTDPLEAAKKAYEQIRGKCDVSVCIYHGGAERDLHTGRVYSDTTENIACRIADEIPFDILLTGHQHTAIESARWNKSHIVQTAANAAHFAKVVWTEGGETRSQLIGAKEITEAPEEVLRLERSVQKWLDAPVSKMTRPLLPEDPLTMARKGTPIAAFFNRVQTEYAGTELSATSLANEVRGFHRSVTVRDVVSTYVYPNTLVVLKITGAQLRTVLENAASYFDVHEDGSIGVSEKFLKPKVSHYNFDYISGVYYRFELSRPVGSRVVSLRRNGKPVRDADVFTITVNNYRATGVGGYDVLRECPREREILTEMSEILLEYFENHPVLAPSLKKTYKVTLNGERIRS